MHTDESYVLTQKQFDAICKRMHKINVLSLFDGMSVAQQALKELHIDVHTYFASEIDKYAVAVTQHNFPDTIQVGAVEELSPADFPSIDLLIGGSPCFEAGTKVLTNKSYKNIEDIKVGDYVLGHTGTCEKVLKIGNQESELYEIKAQGIKPTVTTKNHPYYISSKIKKWNNKKRKYDIYFSDPEWVEVKDAKKGDFLHLPILTTEKNELNITKDEAWVIGRYIADGHTRKDYRVSEGRPNHRQWQLILSIGASKIKHINTNLHYSSFKHTKSTYRVIFSNKRLVEIVEKHCGMGSENKKLSKTLLDLPVNILKVVLEGYFSGDGCKTNNVVRCTSISEELVMSLSLAIAKVYKVNSSFYKTIRPKTTVIEGRVVNQRNTYELHYRQAMSSQSNAVVRGNYILLPIKEVKRLNKKGVVYNLEVQNTNSYTANNAIVHNCQDLSISKRNREGLRGQKSGLFYEYVRLRNAIKPTYFILENVNSMPRESKKQISEILGVEPVMINASLVSAQNRKRLFWIGKWNGKQYEQVETSQPEDQGIVLKDILEEEVDEKYIVKVSFEKKKQDYKDAHNCVQIGTIGKGGQGYRIYSEKGKSITLSANGGGRGAKTGLYAVSQRGRHEDSIIRKLTPTECLRLQSMPDDYFEGAKSTRGRSKKLYPISSTQRCKLCGNAFNCEVIKHILKNLKQKGD